MVTSISRHPVGSNLSYYITRSCQAHQPHWHRLRLKGGPMHNRGAESWSRREFLGRLTLAGTAGVLGLCPSPVAAEPPPEVTRIRLHKMPGICIAPQYVAEELLHAEGFTEVQYVQTEVTELTRAIYRLLASGDLDISMAFAPPLIIQVDTGAPVVLLG